LARRFALVAPKSPLPIGQLVELWAHRDPAAKALRFGDSTWTRAELTTRIRGAAGALQAAGVAAGDFVALVLPTDPRVVELAFGCWMLGATPAPVSHRLPALELQSLLDVLRPKIVIAEQDAAVTQDRKTVAPSALMDAAIAPYDQPSRIAPHVKAIGSGGSTGRPKVIVDHVPSALDPDTPSLGMQSGDTVVIPGPMHHSAPFGLMYQALCWGCHVVIVPRFDPAETLGLVQHHRAAWLYQVPTMMHRIWNLETRGDYDVSSLEVVCHIAAACPAWLKEKWIEWLGPDRIWEVYSGTEALAATMIGGREWLDHRGSVGRPAAGARMRILDESGNDVPTGEIGEIYFLPAKGAGSTYHYLGAEPRMRGEWETFGDLGRLDSDGYLYLADRRTDLIIAGGANIYPAEIEAAIDSYPGVLASVVIGLPDADMGQRIHAIVEVNQDRSSFDVTDLQRFLGARLARYKLPRSIETTHERLRDDAGKVRRSAWRERRLASEEHAP
jgi:bile acid-coenzyme A ligase